MIKAKCVICGEEFEYEKGNKKCCSKECTSERVLILNRWKRKKVKSCKAQTQKNHGNKKSISELQNEARKRGMSYGIYIARIEGGMKG